MTTQSTTQIHPEILRIRSAAASMREAVGTDTDPTAKFLLASAELLELCSQTAARVGTAGHAATLKVADTFLAARGEVTRS